MFSQNVTAKLNRRANRLLQLAGKTRLAIKKRVKAAKINMVRPADGVNVCFCEQQKGQSNTLPRPKGKISKPSLPTSSTEGSKGTNMP